MGQRQSMVQHERPLQLGVGLDVLVQRKEDGAEVAMRQGAVGVMVHRLAKRFHGLICTTLALQHMAKAGPRHGVIAPQGKRGTVLSLSFRQVLLLVQQIPQVEMGRCEFRIERNCLTVCCLCLVRPSQLLERNSQI